MNFRNAFVRGTMLITTVAFIGGCQPTEDQKKAEAEHQATILKFNEELKRLSMELQDARDKNAQLVNLVNIRNKQLTVLKNSLRDFDSSNKLDKKVEMQLQRLAAELGGRLVGNRLELKSDYFFASGKYDLRENSKAAIKELCELLKGRNLMLAVVGHTDSDKIKNPLLRRHGITTNRHLSLMRALSVTEQLVKVGYPAELIYPTGWGDLRRINTSGTKAGKAENRRVDIYIDPAGSNFFAITAIEDVIPTTGASGGPVTE